MSGDLARLDVWRDLGERALFVALPRPGDVSRMPRGSAAATAHAADAGECAFVAGIGGVLVPTLSEFGPEGDVGVRADWTAYEADPVPRHRMEMLDLREIERELMNRLRDHTSRFEEVGGHPWGHRPAPRRRPTSTRRSGASRAPRPGARCASWPWPPTCPASRIAPRASPRSAPAASTPGPRPAARMLLRQLAADADSALADATNVAVMSIAGWRPA